MSLCLMCNKLGELRCGGCKESRYCSKYCQRKDWKLHKLLCKTFADFQERPTSEYSNVKFTRGILFEPDEDSPRFLWVKTTYCRLGGGYLVHEIHDLLTYKDGENQDGRYFASPERNDFNYSRLLDRILPYTIEANFRETFLIDGSKPNKAIKKVSSPASPFLHAWAGPFIVYGYDTVGACHDPQTSVDLTPSDLRHIVDWLNSYMISWSIEKEEQDRSIAMLRTCLSLSQNTPRYTSQVHDSMQGDNMVSCVRLNCLGDVHVDRRPECEALSIPAKHSIFAQAPTPLSERIELPVVVQRLPGSVPEWQTPAKKKAYMGPMSPWCNQDATFLHLGVDPKREDFMNGGYSFGFAPMGWQDDVGTVIVARKDKKPLLPEHVAALTKYCREGLEDYFQECAEGNMTKERVLKEITKAKFETYYKKWQERQEDETARTQVSPYEI